MGRTELPVDAVLAGLLDQLRRDGACVLSAPPGSGKTTRVPGAIVDAGIPGQVWVLQPRRLAARAAARRVAWERGVPLGGEVGYQVRHDRKAGRDTRIRFVTEGILARRVLRDPFLEGIAAVVIDEFHERSLEADLVLAMLAEIRATVREDLLLVVMSATLEVEPLLRFLAPCGQVEAQGRMFAVDVEYLPDLRREGARHAARAALKGLDETPGDGLVFLPGVREIEAVQQVLRAGDREGMVVLPLHGRLGPAAQDAALAAVPGRRKIVLATNIAETSLTVPGVTAVIDAGWQRTQRHDPGRGLDRLETLRISRAAAEQRRGRAGRTAPGRCYRLWSMAEERGMAEFDLPEIRRLDLAGMVLQARAFSGRPPSAFGWFEAPEPAGLERADRLLHLLGAVADDRLTGMGTAMLAHPVHPRLARMLEEGRRRGCGRAAAELAGLLTERDLQRGAAVADLFEWTDRLHELEAAGLAPATARRLGLDLAVARAVIRSRDQLARGLEDRGVPAASDLVRTLLAGYPDRVCRRMDPHARRAVMATGRGCELTMADHEALGPLFLAVLVRDSAHRQQANARVDLACALAEPWLEEVFPGSIVVTEEVALDRDRAAVVAWRRRRFGALVLDERQAGRPPDDAAAALLAAELAKDPWAFLGEQRELRRFLARLDWLRRTLPEAAVPAIGGVELAAAAVALAPGRFRLSDFRDLRLLETIRSTLPPSLQERLRREAPATVRLPSGREAPIDYDGAEPFVAARMQEFFGLAETPRLAGGRAALLLHLLAPNQRPVQITSDLGSFWEHVYPRERAELRRRYPKHSWPEDPATAVAEARPPRRR